MYSQNQIAELESAGFALVELEEGSQGPSQHIKNPQPIAPSAPRTTGMYQPTNERQGFDCSATRTGVNALSSIPRDPVTIVAPIAFNAGGGQDGTVPFEVPSESEVSVGLDSVVGMYLCELEADFQIFLDGTSPASQDVVDAYIETLMRSGRFTLTFRDEDVANLRNLRMGELVWNPECCGTEFGACVGSILPDYGVLAVDYDMPQPPPGIQDVIISVSIEANGCGCTCGKGGCGC
jgi:hypothetical protein